MAIVKGWSQILTWRGERRHILKRRKTYVIFFLTIPKYDAITRRPRSNGIFGDREGMEKNVRIVLEKFFKFKCLINPSSRLDYVLDHVYKMEKQLLNHETNREVN